MVTAHLGRPKGAPESKYSLAPAAARLGELLGATVPLADDLVGPSARETVAALAAGGIAMLENVRFDARETSKDAAERAALADDLVGVVGAGRRFRLRRLRRRAPQAGLGLRDRAEAAALRRLPGVRGDRGAEEADRRPGPAVRGHPRRLEGVRQARRDHLAAAAGSIRC